VIAHHFSICVKYPHFIANASALPLVLKGTFLMNNDCRRFVLEFVVSLPVAVVQWYATGLIILKLRVPLLAMGKEKIAEKVCHNSKMK
jgi:hypothetical protein